MKYFVNYPYTAESLKREYRELCKRLHPDTGGSKEAFQEMQNEYAQVTNDLKRANEEAEAREAMKRAAEERRRREERERKEEEERKAKARPDYERRCKQWAHLMEDLTSYREAEESARKNYGWSSQEAKAAGIAFRAARRRNLVAMAKAVFPGIKFTASINTGWGGGATISWSEGPTVEEFKAATDYHLFVSGWDTFDGMTDCAGYEHAMFTEFANNYGDFSGTVSYDRTEAKEHRDEVADLICSVKPSAAEQRVKDGRRDDCSVLLKDDEIVKICGLLGIDADEFKKAHSIHGDWGESKYFDLWVEWFTKWSHYTPQPKAPEFAPKYGKTYKTIKKALGGNVFGYRKSDVIADIFALCDDLDELEIGKIFVWEGKKEFSGMYSSNYKNTAARIEKMKAVGITLDGCGCKVVAVADDVRAALRREREDIEQQLAAWKAEQRGETATETTTERTADTETANSKPTAQTTATAAENEQQGNEQPADYLRKYETDTLTLYVENGRTYIIGKTWKDTYFSRRDLKAHGAHWNGERNQWEATAPADRQALESWFYWDFMGHDKKEWKPEADTLQDSGEIIDTTTDATDESEPQAGPRKLQNVEVLTNDFGTVRVGDRVTDGRHVGKFLCYVTQGPNDPGTLVIIADDLQVHEANPLKVRKADTATGPQQPQSDEKPDSPTRIRFAPEDLPDYEEAA